MYLFAGEVKYKCSPFTEEQKKDIDLNKKTIGQIPYEKKVCEKTKNNRYVINGKFGDDLKSCRLADPNCKCCQPLR